MRHLYLLRHAKSSWKLAGQLDYERGLTERGEDDLVLISELIREHEIAPDFIFCSGARRARDTLAGVANELPRDARVEYTDEIYQASTRDLLLVLQGVPSMYNSVLLIGHNPSIHNLSVEIARESNELVSLAAKFPTAALAEFEFEGDWADLDENSADLTRFTRPKQLRQGDRETL